MFVREKRIGRYTYVYLVETVREDGRTRQRIIRNLGRKEDVERRGDLDRLARSAARLAQRSMILSLTDEGSAPALACRRIGPPLLFERLWRDTRCGEVVAELLAQPDRLPTFRDGLSRRRPACRRRPPTTPAVCRDPRTNAGSR